MRAFYFKTIRFPSARASLNHQPRLFHVRFFSSQPKINNTYFPKFTFNETDLLHYLSTNKIHHARNLFDKMAERGDRHGNLVHFTSLLTKYSKQGFIDEAKALYHLMPNKNVVTYNAMLSGFLLNGRLNEAVNLFEEMPERNVVSCTALICGFFYGGRVLEAKKLFAEMPERNIVSWNSMVVGLIRNGELNEARRVFDSIPVKNVISWNVMIGGYVENFRMGEAMVLFENMEEEKNVVTWTSMISGYCRVGEVEEAFQLFCQMPERNIVSWTSMIGGFAWNGFYEDALSLFIEMKRKYIKPNEETFISLAYACSGLGSPRLCKQLHNQVIINGLDYNDYDGRLLRSFIHMYSMLGVMDFARSVYKENVNYCTVQSVNSLINGYIRIGNLNEAENLFYTTPIRDEISWTSMIDGYLSFGQVSRACYLFHYMLYKDAIAWTTMISGHVQNELFTEAIYLFLDMRGHGVAPLNSTYSVLFGAIGATANLDQGKEIHCMMIKTQSESDLILENSLISMYAKCGVIDDAFRVFSNMGERDLISWNSIIMGFSHHGKVKETLQVFKSMLESGFPPNSVTFLGVLSACSHAGLVHQGFNLFYAMSNVYEIQPGLEHYICMINLLGRAGKVKEAEEFILRLPFQPDHHIWGALLGLCGLGEKNPDIAERVAKRVLELDPLNAPAHVVLCNIYAASGWHIKEHELRKKMGLKGVRKIPGCSWVTVNGGVHVFRSGEKVQKQVHEVLALLFGIGTELYGT